MPTPNGKPTETKRYRVIDEPALLREAKMFAMAARYNSTECRLIRGLLTIVARLSREPDPEHQMEVRAERH